jgi:ribosome-associated heat shock protein Hsp15
VHGLNEYRRPAAEAQQLYAETPESAQRRTEAAELRKLSPMAEPDLRGRPTKRDRRQLGRFRGF